MKIQRLIILPYLEAAYSSAWLTPPSPHVPDRASFLTHPYMHTHPSALCYEPLLCPFPVGSSRATGVVCVWEKLLLLLS